MNIAHPYPRFGGARIQSLHSGCSLFELLHLCKLVAVNWTVPNTLAKYRQSRGIAPSCWICQDPTHLKPETQDTCVRAASQSAPANNRRPRRIFAQFAPLSSWLPFAWRWVKRELICDHPLTQLSSNLSQGPHVYWAAELPNIFGIGGEF